MAFSFGRKFNSFLSEAVPSAFKSSLGTVQVPEMRGVIDERPAAGPASPIFRSYGGGLTAVTPLTSYAAPAQAPDPSQEFQAFPTYRPSATSGEYWNTALERSGLTRAQHLRRIGSSLRDPEEPISPPEPFRDLPVPSPQGVARGGGVGGIGGAGTRRSPRGWS